MIPLMPRRRSCGRRTPTVPSLLLVLLACGVLEGCATLPPAATPDPRDPFERFNRASFAFNDRLDRAIVKPVARGYRRVLPDFVELAITNVFSNARTPITIVNSALQGKFRDAGASTGRFLLNSTIGIGGIGDPASELGIERRSEDFGQTLGRWGVGPGPYVMVPFLGPYTVRDGFGSLVDNFAEPRHYLEDDSTRYGLWLFDKLDQRARLLDAETLMKRAGDPYAFIRSAYLQRREYLVRDGEVALDEEMLEDPADEEDPAATDEARSEPPGRVTPPEPRPAPRTDSG